MEGSERSLSRRDARNSTTNVPLDLIVEIISLLPLKPLIRFQSVSKLWFSTIRSKSFVDSFLTRSKTRPRLLFPYMQVESRKHFILSAPEHNNKEDDQSSSTVTVRHDMTISDPVYYTISPPVNGLICCIGDSSIAVCNPATRQTVKLPDVTPNGRDMYARLGYDPVEDQYKVLCVMMTKFNSSRPGEQETRQEHLVCTVRSSEKEEWRKIENTTIDSYRSFSRGICIDGAIYYETGQSEIVRFDVRTENINLIKAPEESDFSTTIRSTLLNYKGKLGGLYYDYKNVMRLWILEDAEKQEWSSITCVLRLPSELNCILTVSKRDVHTGELMVFQKGSMPSKPLCVWYYDIKKESIIRKIEVMVDADFRRIHGINEKTYLRLCYPGYFENIRFL